MHGAGDEEHHEDQNPESAQEDHLHGFALEQMRVFAANDEHADDQADYIADDVDQTGRQSDEIDVKQIGAIFTGRLE